MAPDLGNGIDYGDPELNATEQRISDTFDEPDDDQPPADPSADDTPPSTEDGGDGTAGAAGDGSAQDGDASAGGQQQATPEDHLASGPIHADAKGNLVDQHGRIVATAGPQRRLWEKSQKQERYIGQLERDIAALRDTASTTGQLDRAATEMRVSSNDARLGMQIMGNFRKDPLSVAKWALQETLALGYTLPQITGQPGTAADINMQAVQKMLDDRLGPLVNDRNVQKQQADEQATAVRAYNEFLAKHDYAEVHQETIAKLMRGNPDLTAPLAYWQLREWAVRNGFDFREPLEPQVVAAQGRGQQAPRNNNGHAQPNNAQPSVPMPNGGNPNANMRTEPQIAAPDEDWDRIVQSSLREAGMI